ncbi:MAG: hypothetical protein PHD76_11670 [Methylacidiphilales bacterium]|nr:hypothetical protein [Candidatus Methylacidiphilales bacterium]
MALRLLPTKTFFLSLGFASLLTSPLFAQVQIREVVPGKVYLETSGLEIPLMLHGTGFKTLTKAEAFYEGNPDPYLSVQLGVPGENRVSVTLIARPDTPLGPGHSLRLKTEDEAWVEVPLVLEIVAPGDKRATKPNTASALEAVEVAKGKRVVISESKAPVITNTVPKPLYVEPNGQSQTLVLKGRNLQSITDVRVRKASQPPKYRNQEGILPARLRQDTIEVDVLATPDTPVGEKYALDLMIKEYLAGTVTFVVGKPAPPQAAPVPAPRVIEIPGPIPTNPPAP